jgi:hypothetical protein
MIRDLHILPKARDRWSYLYVERARVVVVTPSGFFSGRRRARSPSPWTTKARHQERCGIQKILRLVGSTMPTTKSSTNGRCGPGTCTTWPERELTRWLLEVRAGVFVGTSNLLLRHGG